MLWLWALVLGLQWQAQSVCAIFRSSLFQRQSSLLENVVFTPELAFEKSHVQKLRCALLCQAHSACVTFTFTPETPQQGSRCRGHSRVLVVTDSKEDSPGTVLFEEFTPCSIDPCQNGGQCTNDGNTYICTCAPGFTGTTCEEDIDDCAASPCMNGGSCVDGLNSYVCACALGFTGSNCETDIDDCAASPCMNGGTCTDGINSYTCTCAEGFTGNDCKTDIDDCAASPCMNGGTCTDGLNSYTCTCAVGFTGNDCETDIDDCAAVPCMNGGTCTDGINSYICTCAGGYAGNDCETDIDDCAASPCMNGGTCADGINSYTCTCSGGYTGNDCETDIDDCAASPCMNGGTCADGINSYTCTCAGGYTGNDCETALSTTWLYSACQGPSDCTETNADCIYSKCLCIPGYYYSESGQTCNLECPQSDLLDDYVTYPKHNILGYNTGLDYVDNADLCKAVCDVVATCRTCEYLASSRSCNTGTVTFLTAPSSSLVTDNAAWVHFQRKCV